MYKTYSGNEMGSIARVLMNKFNSSADISEIYGDAEESWNFGDMMNVQ
jgi:hypothetical protein